MKITPKQYAQVLFDLIKTSETGQLNAVIEDFVKLLIDHNQVSQIDKIISKFEELWNKENKIIKAEIFSAKKLDDDVINLLKQYIKKQTQSEEIKLETKVRKSLIGGFVIRYQDKIVDASLKNRIRQLKSKLS